MFFWSLIATFSPIDAAVAHRYPGDWIDWVLMSPGNIHNINF